MATNTDEQAPNGGGPHKGPAMAERVQEARRKAEFIASRAFGLFVKPEVEWDEIRREETNAAAILIGYVAPLAAIPPVCDLLGSIIFAHVLQGDITSAVVRAAVTFVASVAVVFLLGLLINAAAEHFDADRDDLAAQKVAAYAMTPTFLAGVFSLWPPLWWLAIFAIGYTVYLIYRGLPILMKAPEDRAIGYTISVTVSGTVAFVILFGLASCVSF